MSFNLSACRFFGVQEVGLAVVAATYGRPKSSAPPRSVSGDLIEEPQSRSAGLRYPGFIACVAKASTSSRVGSEGWAPSFVVASAPAMLA